MAAADKTSPTLQDGTPIRGTNYLELESHNTWYTLKHLCTEQYTARVITGIEPESDSDDKKVQKYLVLCTATSNSSTRQERVVEWEARE